MKVRNGFVSNSSSSSFTMYVKKEDYDRIFKDLTSLEKNILEHVSPGKVKAFGLDLMLISYGTGNASAFEDYGYNGAEELTNEEEEIMNDEGPESIINNIIDKFEGLDTLSHSQDI